ncbi:MAG: ribosome-associated translation inhibitor RaiA [Elusimicrobiota bacterium]
MQINIVARHLDLTPAISEYVKKKIEKCQRFFDKLVWTQVILSVEKYRQLAEIIMHAGRVTFRAKEESIDLYAAIDLAADKIEKQLKKHKEITKVHRKSKSSVSVSGNTRSIKQIITVSNARTGKHLISEVKRFDIKPLSLSEAIDEMELFGYSFYMFMNADSSHINVVYVRDNGTYGLLEPEI